MKKKKNFWMAVTTLVIAITCIIVMIPLYYTVLNSFKPYSEIAADISALPKNFTLANYKDAWGRLKFPRALMNTVIVTVFSSIGCILFSGTTGYWIARHKNKVTSFWNILFISGMCVPFQGIMIGFAKMIGILNLGNHYIGIILSLVVYSLPMSIFLVTGAVKSVPYEIEEAAIIDGCSNLQLYWKVVFPLIKGTMFTIVSLEALNYWNDYLMTQFILTKETKRTLQIAMQSLFNEAFFSWDTAVAAVTLSILPMFIFFVIAQKQIMGGMMAGAVKG